MTKELKPVELFIEQLNVAYERNLILSLSVNCPHITIIFHKETDAITIDKVVETIRKNYQSIHKMRIECHRLYASRHYYYVLDITLDK